MTNERAPSGATAAAVAAGAAPAGRSSSGMGERAPSKTLTGMIVPFAEQARETGQYATLERSQSSTPPPNSDGQATTKKSDSSGLRAVVIDKTAEISLLWSMFESTSDAMILANTHGIIARWNCAAETFFGIDADSAIGESLFRLLDEMAVGGKDLIKQLRLHKSVANARTEIVTQSGQRTYALASLNYVAGTGDQPAGIVATFKDNSEVERLTRTDALTGVANRREFDDLIAKAYANLDRDIGGPLSLLFLDIDDFKKFNTDHGHQVADEVLRMVGETLQQGTRTVDFAARLKAIPGRYGGEEFVLILPNTNAEGAMQLAERLRKRIADIRIELEGVKDLLCVTASFGVATHTYANRSRSTDLIGQANSAMRDAKTAGKNRSIAFKPAI